MFLQKFLKGISGIDDLRADHYLRKTGILCRWWDRVNTISPEETWERLTPDNLDWHLNRYDQPNPRFGGDPFYEHTPYISTTAGTVERDEMLRRNRVYSPFLTALDFATRGLSEIGYIFYGYVFTLGRKSVPLREFAEEVRELNIYTTYLPFHPEGEIVAKINIPTVNLEKYERYDPDEALSDLLDGRRPRPTNTQHNDRYAEPKNFINLRDLLEL